MAALTFNVQKHALLMASYPALCLAVKPSQIAESHPADGQHGFAVTAADLKPPVPTLEDRHTKFCSRTICLSGLINKRKNKTERLVLRKSTTDCQIPFVHFSILA